MSRSIALLALTITALAIAGCGASNKPTPPSAKRAPEPAQSKITSRSYTVALTGRDETPSTLHGAATATISLARSHDQVCWKVATLTGLPTPLHGYIQQGAAGRSGAILIALGETYRPSGCANGIGPALLERIEAHPGRFYLNLETRAHPLGALRGQL